MPLPRRWQVRSVLYTSWPAGTLIVTVACAGSELASGDRQLSMRHLGDT